MGCLEGLCWEQVFFLFFHLIHLLFPVHSPHFVMILYWVSMKWSIKRQSHWFSSMEYWRNWWHTFSFAFNLFTFGYLICLIVCIEEVTVLSHSLDAILNSSCFFSECSTTPKCSSPTTQTSTTPTPQSSAPPMTSQLQFPTTTSQQPTSRDLTLKLDEARLASWGIPRTPFKNTDASSNVDEGTEEIPDFCTSRIFSGTMFSSRLRSTPARSFEKWARPRARRLRQTLLRARNLFCPENFGSWSNPESTWHQI